jgi:hypothetical protein
VECREREDCILKYETYINEEEEEEQSMKTQKLFYVCLRMWWRDSLSINKHLERKRRES